MAHFVLSSFHSMILESESANYRFDLIGDNGARQSTHVKILARLLCPPWRFQRHKHRVDHAPAKPRLRHGVGDKWAT
jgi:hypothetical protein